MCKRYRRKTVLMTIDSQSHCDNSNCDNAKSDCQTSITNKVAHQRNERRNGKLNSAQSIFDNVPYFDFFIDLSAGESGSTLHTVADRQVRDIVAILRPKWKKIDFEIFTNGITNKIFAVSNFKSDYSDDRLVFRIFGRGTSKIINREHELKNMALLGAHGIAAPLFAKFRNGIVCGYLNGRCLDVQSVRQPHVIEKICENIARMHKISCDENESFIFDKLDHYFTIIPVKYECVQKQRDFDNYFTANEVNLKQDVTNLRKQIEEICRHSAINSRIVFSHNDLLIYNILYDEKSDKINFIDYEYAAANYQLFDLANYFCEYAGVNEPDYSLCPNDAEKSNFIRCYLRHYDEAEPSDEVVKIIVKDIRLFEAAAHLFWCVWNIAQSHLSDINFDYIQYGITRHKEFTKIKNSM